MTKEERAAKWDAEFIACKNHPEKRCQRSKYVHAIHRICSWCVKHKADGAMRQGEVRYVASDKMKAVMRRKNTSELGRIRRERYYRSDKGQMRQAWKIERKLHG